MIANYVIWPRIIIATSRRVVLCTSRYSHTKLANATANYKIHILEALSRAFLANFTVLDVTDFFSCFYEDT